MKAQLVAQDFAGVHNCAPDATRARLLRGASWKKQRIIQIMPAADLIPAKVALSHCNLIFPPNNGVYRMLALGMEVGDAYSQAIEQILLHGDLSTWEYILTLEHDNMPPNDGVLTLCAQLDQHPEFACIGGLYFTKGEGGVAQIWGDISDPIVNYRPQIPRENQLMECYGTGMGFNLWRLSMFKDRRLARPWFKTRAGKDGVGTQDLAFWADARKYGYRCAVDCAVRVGHYDHAQDIVW